MKDKYDPNFKSSAIKNDDDIRAKEAQGYWNDAIALADKLSDDEVISFLLALTFSKYRIARVMQHSAALLLLLVAQATLPVARLKRG